MEALMEYQECLRSIGWLGMVQSKTYVGYLVDGYMLNPATFTMPPPPAHGDKPLYKIYLIGDSPAGAQFPDGLMEDMQKFAQGLGVVSVLGIYTRLTGEKFAGIGLERYPNVQALHDHYEYIEKHDWFKYSNARTYVGKGIGGVLVEG